MSRSRTFLPVLIFLLLVPTTLSRSGFESICSFLHGEARTLLGTDDLETDPIAFGLVSLDSRGRFRILIDGEEYHGTVHSIASEGDDAPSSSLLKFDRVSRDRLRHRAASRLDMMFGELFTIRKFWVYGSVTFPEGGWWIETTTVKTGMQVTTRHETLSATHEIHLSK